MRGHFQCLAVVASFERRALSMLSGNVMAQHNIAQGRKMQCACVIGGFVFKPCLCVLHSLGLFRPLMCTNKVSSWTAPFGQGPRALPLTCVTAAHGGLHRGFTRVPPAHANETPNVSKHQQSQLCASPSSSRNWRLDPSFSVGPLVGLGLDRIHEWQPHLQAHTCGCYYGRGAAPAKGHHPFPGILNTGHHCQRGTAQMVLHQGCDHIGSPLQCQKGELSAPHTCGKAGRWMHCVLPGVASRVILSQQLALVRGRLQGTQVCKHRRVHCFGMPFAVAAPFRSLACTAKHWHCSTAGYPTESGFTLEITKQPPVQCRHTVDTEAPDWIGECARCWHTPSVPTTLLACFGGRVSSTWCSVGW